MVLRPLEELLRIGHAEEVDLTDEHRRELRAELPDDLSKVVAPMAVQYDKPSNACARDGIQDIVQEGRLRTGEHVHVQLDVELPRVHAIRNRTEERRVG